MTVVNVEDSQCSGFHAGIGSLKMLIRPLNATAITAKNGTTKKAISQNVPGRASAGHSRRVARSWPDGLSGTGLEPCPVGLPERLGARADLVEGVPLDEVAAYHDGVREVLRDVTLVGQELRGQLRQRRLVA